ncbi:hypothetical protein B0T22DRAFT_502070 [Podospora appendiculata]|uniref:DUF3669 domain-containing protein n=1 Tax=Podospora appendiculata TaxID=314037 RepID=A0AAE0X299_9PEZI|nr:hypothetical protein B0T22DRAFT_502070 [Podospora appendiculata]
MALSQNESLSPSPASASETLAVRKDLDKELHRMLSLGSQISTSPSTAERHAKAQAKGQAAFRKIGASACGSVFAQDRESVATKLAKSPDHTELWNDYQMHEEIARGFHRYIIDKVGVPECYFFDPSDRPRIKDKARADPANSDCLVRVYLGSMQGKIGGNFFSLRNFKLHLNHMMDLELDTEALARRMGSALAVLHWGAKTDARDVEFVLGSSTEKTIAAAKPIPVKNLKPCTYTGLPTDEIEDFFCRATELFVLDFNQVRTITMDDEGVAMAAFVVSYLTALHEVMTLPRKFILGITEVERVKMLSRKV